MSSYSWRVIRKIRKGESFKKSLVEKYGEDSDEDEELKMNEDTTGRRFVSMAPKSPMASKVHDLFISLNIPLNSYHTIYVNLTTPSLT